MDDVYDRDISREVGNDTYKALWSIFPNLYSRLYDNMIPLQCEVDKVNSITTSADCDLGPKIKSDLIRYIQDSRKGLHPDPPSTCGILIHSTPYIEIPGYSYIITAIWTIVISLITILVVWNISMIFKIHPLFFKKPRYARTR